MDKKSFRKVILTEAFSLPESYIKSSDNGIYENFIQLPEFSVANTIFAYLSEKHEPDTINIINKAIEKGKTVALPVCYNEGRMEARIIQSLLDLIPGKFGIPVPEESAPLLRPEDIDIIIVPAITFNRQGYRLGRGGGYYDRFLGKSPAFSIGLGRERLLRDIPLQPHDLPVSCLITEAGIYKTERR